MKFMNIFARQQLAKPSKAQVFVRKWHPNEKEICWERNTGKGIMTSKVFKNTDVFKNTVFFKGYTVLYIFYIYS